MPDSKLLSDFDLKQFSIVDRAKKIDANSTIFANTVGHDINLRHTTASNEQRYFRFRSTNTDYFENELIEALHNGSFYFPAAEQMNDPFDVYPIYSTPVTFEYYREKVFPINWTTSIYNLGVMVIQGKLSYAKYKKQIAQLDKPTDEFIRVNFESYCSNSHQLIDIFFKKPRILSLSGSYSNQMLWAMYASRHTGICFEVSGLNNPKGFDHPDSMGHAMKPLEVLYGNTRPEMNPIGIALCHVVADTKCLKFLPPFARKTVWDNLLQLDYIRTKNITWSHENEYRLIIHAHEQGNQFKLSGITIPNIFLGFDVPEKIENFVLETVIRVSPKTSVLKGQVVDNLSGLSFTKIY